MKYVVKNGQDLDALLEERCIKAQEIDGDWEWDGLRWYGCDAIIIDTKGKWFDKKIVSRLHVWEGSVVKCIPVTKIKPEDKEKVRNTILYIQENFDHIYQVMLETLLPTLTGWGMQNFKTREPVTTFQQIHDAHGTEVIAGMEAGCITTIQLNCRYQKEDMVFYSLTYRPDCSTYGFDDGFEVVFWKDKVVFFMDGNTEEAIFQFENYKEWPTYFGV